MQCHIQEITTSVAVDESGVYCFGGTKSGRVFCWLLATGELISSFSAHYKAVTCLSATSPHFLVSASEDGMVKLWSIDQIVSSTSFSTRQANSNSSADNSSVMTALQPYRSWTPHSLPVTCLAVLLSSHSIRIVTGSSDQSLAIHDAHTNRLIYHTSYPEALECLALHPMLSEVWIGTISGAIHILDLTVTSSALSTATSVNRLGTSVTNASSTLNNFHTKPITSVAFSIDGARAVSSSTDGSVRVWDTLTRQCVRDWKPFDGAPVTNVKVTSLPDILSSSLASAKQTAALAPIGHLRKFPGPPHRLADTSSVAASVAAANAARDGTVEMGARHIAEAPTENAINCMITALNQCDPPALKSLAFSVLSTENEDMPLNTDFVSLPEAPSETKTQKKRRSTPSSTSPSHPPAAIEEDTSEPLLKRQDTYGSGLEDFVGVVEDVSNAPKKQRVNKKKNTTK